jgi:hypothetical protein
VLNRARGNLAHQAGKRNVFRTVHLSGSFRTGNVGRQIARQIIPRSTINGPLTYNMGKCARTRPRQLIIYSCRS